MIYKGLFTTGLALTSTLLYTPVSYAGDPSSNDLLKITVTGERKENQVIDYAGSVDVIDKNELELNPTNSIRNLLRDIPGVTTRNSVRKGSRGTPGTTDVNIRGMEGDRNLFIIDNVRLPDRYEYGGYYDLGRANYVDFSFLNSVEIIKGSQVDFAIEGLNQGVRFMNPNANAVCGCGESFTVMDEDESTDAAVKKK